MVVDKNIVYFDDITKVVDKNFSFNLSIFSLATSTCGCEYLWCGVKNVWCKLVKWMRVAMHPPFQKK